MAKGDDGVIFCADDGVDAGECLDLLCGPDHPAQGLNCIPGHQVPHPATAVELAFAVSQYEGHRRLVDTSLLRSLARMAGKCWPRPSLRFIMAITVGHNMLRLLDAK